MGVLLLPACTCTLLHTFCFMAVLHDRQHLMPCSVVAHQGWRSCLTPSAGLVGKTAEQQMVQVPLQGALLPRRHCRGGMSIGMSTDPSAT